MEGIRKETHAGRLLAPNVFRLPWNGDPSLLGCVLCDLEIDQRANRLLVGCRPRVQRVFLSDRQVALACGPRKE